MTRLTIRWLVGIASAVGATAAIWHAAAASAGVIATVTTNGIAPRAGHPLAGVPPIDAFHDRVVWSAYDSSHHVWRLMETVPEGTQPVPIRPRRSPFDVDLGPGPDGSPVAVYSRCSRHYDLRLAAPEGRAHGCDVFEYSFAHNRETRLSGSKTRDETWPAIWRSRLAFVTPGRHGPEVHIGSTSRRRALRRVTRGVKAGTISELDMRRRSIAYTWTVRRARSSRSFVRAVLNGRDSAQIGPGAETSGAVRQSVSGPQLTADAMIWTYADLAGSTVGGHVVRQALDAGCRVGFPSATGSVGALAVAQAGATIYVLQPATSPTSLILRALPATSFGALPLGWLRVADPTLRRPMEPGRRSGPYAIGASPTDRCLF